MQSPTSSPEAIMSPSLSDLSRKASVFSTSSSSDGDISDSGSPTPKRMTPPRRFEGPLSRTRSPLLPPTARKSRPPSFLTKELGPSSTAPLRRPRNGSRSSLRSDSQVGMDLFEVGATLGHGSYSTVFLATHRRTARKYAVKAVDKGHLERNRKTSTVQAERAALTVLTASGGHPGIIQLHYFFEDTWSFYFVIDWAPRGDLQSLIARTGSLSSECSRYYAAQIVDAVRYMHKRGVIHRDLKPENVLLDENLRIKIADFGTAIVLDTDVEPEKFAGTAQYMAPEQIDKNISSKSSDIWSVGCVIYQMLAGHYPFPGFSTYLVMESVRKIAYTFPEGFDSQGKDLVQQILVRDPSQRLGGAQAPGKDMSDLTRHPFFSSIAWPDLWTMPVPRILPGLVMREKSDVNTPDGAIDGIEWVDAGDYTASEDAVQSDSDDESSSSDLESSVAAMHVNPDSQPTPDSSPENSSPTRTDEFIQAVESLTLKPTKLKTTRPTILPSRHISP